MWEERLESVMVRNRRVSEVRSPDEPDVHGEEASDDVWEELEMGSEVPFIPLQYLNDTDGPGDGGGKSGKLKSSPPPPEVTEASDATPRKLLLSGWGESLHGRQRFEVPLSSTCSYALLSAEVPYLQERVLPVASKCAKRTEAVPVSWNQPDLKILYQFASQRDYLQMASNLKAGLLSQVKGYRAVTLEPVRIIDGSLRASLELTFPHGLCQEVRVLLKPLLDSAPISLHFLHISTETEKLFKPPKEASPPGTLPSLLLTLITPQNFTSTAMKVMATFSQPHWSCRHLAGSPGLPTSSPSCDEVQELSGYGGSVPLFSLATGQAGTSMEDSIRLTLLCGGKLREMVEFYCTVLDIADPYSCPSHVIFPLVSRPVCTVELCLLEGSQTTPTHLLRSSTIHVYVEDIAMVMWQLGRSGHILERSAGVQGCWLVADPCGNRVCVHNKRGLACAPWT